jgi:hypothetical protein
VESQKAAPGGPGFPVRGLPVQGTRTQRFPAQGARKNGNSPGEGPSPGARMVQLREKIGEEIGRIAGFNHPAPRELWS